MTNNGKIQNQSALLMLEWMVAWSETKLNKNEGTQLSTSSATLQNAADVLAKFGITKQNPQDKAYIYITSDVSLPNTYDFEEILYAYYDLGNFYGYGVLFLEEGFMVADDLKQLFQNLVQLGYCNTANEFYFWTEKTSEVSSRYYGLQFKRKESVYSEYLQHLIPSDTQSARDLLMTIHLRKKLGLNKNSNSSEVKTALTAWLNKWQKNPILWPAMWAENKM